MRSICITTTPVGHSGARHDTSAWFRRHLHALGLEAADDDVDEYLPATHTHATHQNTSQAAAVRRAPHTSTSPSHLDDACAGGVQRRPIASLRDDGAVHEAWVRAKRPLRQSVGPRLRLCRSPAVDVHPMLARHSRDERRAVSNCRASLSTHNIAVRSDSEEPRADPRRQPAGVPSSLRSQSSTMFTWHHTAREPTRTANAAGCNSR